ncbi:hypothetical protein N7492_007587 [Penicillium capsulatum]|uniref:Uncharacterized protein n=1 Tax=Penicillium capsulatum TaxID=69766 RepID=A0A9W9I489_9EURO|nr:hypothetical protein N7492_007587 [Penicillium capsulatum]
MDDDYVAQVIAKEARDSSQKYASEGLGAYMPVRKCAQFHIPLFLTLNPKLTTTVSRPASNAPKPNTRFLRHLIKETDSHNLALKRKEERESRDRMRQLGRQTTTGAEQRTVNTDIARTGEGTEAVQHLQVVVVTAIENDHIAGETETMAEIKPTGGDPIPGPGVVPPAEIAPPAVTAANVITVVPARHLKDRATKPPPVVLMGDNSAEESDPLEDLVGPLPQKSGEEPIRSRGRGAYKPNSSTIDAHFAPDYDPTLDVQLDGDGERVATARASRRPVAGLTTDDDDWDMALEALRDRAHWRQKGDERLRAAGMNENTIGRWKDNDAFSGLDGEGKPEDVRWSKKGEGREWDRGKFVNDDGHIDVRAAWQS